MQSDCLWAALPYRSHEIRIMSVVLFDIRRRESSARLRVVRWRKIAGTISFHYRRRQHPQHFPFDKFQPQWKQEVFSPRHQPKTFHQRSFTPCMSNGRCGNFIFSPANCWEAFCDMMNFVSCVVNGTNEWETHKRNSPKWPESIGRGLGDRPPPWHYKLTKVVTALSVTSV